MTIFNSFLYVYLPEGTSTITFVQTLVDESRRVLSGPQSLRPTELPTLSPATAGGCVVEQLCAGGGRGLPPGNLT